MEAARLAADIVPIVRVATKPDGRRDWERVVGQAVPQGMTMPRAWAAWDIAAAIVEGVQGH